MRVRHVSTKLAAINGRWSVRNPSDWIVRLSSEKDAWKAFIDQENAELFKDDVMMAARGSLARSFGRKVVGL